MKSQVTRNPANVFRGSDGEEHIQIRKERSSENRREGQTLPLRQVPQTKPETG
jgi:hypothetical protein